MLKDLFFVFFLLTLFSSTTSLWCKCRYDGVMGLNNKSMQTATHDCCDEQGLEKTKKMWTNHCDLGDNETKTNTFHYCCVRKGNEYGSTWVIECS